MVTGFMTKSPQFTLHESEAVEVGDVALVRSRWTVRMTEHDGKETEVNVEPTLVARQQPDGCWLVVIDRPLGKKRAPAQGVAS
jgi:ketosteroid isomerase-like protein